MKNEDKTRDQLIEELKEKQRELEAKIAESEQFTCQGLTLYLTSIWRMESVSKVTIITFTPHLQEYNARQECFEHDEHLSRC
jgi:hypothetical protein